MTDLLSPREHFPAQEPEPTLAGIEASIVREQDSERSLLETMRAYSQDIMTDYTQWSERYPFAATTAETVALFAFKTCVLLAGKKVGIRTGNAMSDLHAERAVQKPVAALLTAAVIAPVAEELLFRVAPAKTEARLEAVGSVKAARMVTTVADLGFAASHAGFVVPAGLKPRFKLRPSRREHSLPIVQYVGGKQYRRLYEKRGLKHSIYAHTLNNLTGAIVGAPRILSQRAADS